MKLLLGLAAMLMLGCGQQTAGSPAPSSRAQVASASAQKACQVYRQVKEEALGGKVDLVATPAEMGQATSWADLAKQADSRYQPLSSDMHAFAVVVQGLAQGQEIGDGQAAVRALEADCAQL